MAEIVSELKLAPRGGAGGFGASDDSENLEDMRYAEKLIFNGKVGKLAFLEALATLKVAEEESQEDGSVVVKGGVILLDRNDIPDLPTNEEIGITGICQRIDSEFVALEIPFKSQAHMSDEARARPAVEVEIKRGKNKGKMRKEKPADMIKIYRVSEDFDIDNYAATASKRCQPKKVLQDVVDESGKTVKKEVIVDGSTDYNEPTTGQRLRAAKWLKENGEAIADTLEAIGLSFE